MTTLNNTIIVALAAFAFVTTGCGEFPESSEASDGTRGSLNIEAQPLGTSEGLSADDLILADFSEAHVVERVFPALEEENENSDLPLEAWDDTQKEPVVLPIFTEDEEEEQVNAVEPMPAGFADGCASQDEWTRLADSVCETYDATLAHVTLGGSCGQAQYQVSNFGCMIAGDHKTETTYREFNSVLLGDEAACKTIEGLRGLAADVCGTAGNVVELKGLAECDGADDSDETRYQAARVTCTEMK